MYKNFNFGDVVKVSFDRAPHHQLDNPSGTYDFEVEGNWKELTGKSWGDSDGNLACLVYAFRIGSSILNERPVPMDDNVLYGKINGLGFLVHETEILDD